MNYLLLQHPGHNRVYYLQSDKLALAELTIAVNRLEVRCSQPKIELIEGIRYLSVDTDKEFTRNDLLLISGLSFIFALFKRISTSEGKALIPIKLPSHTYLDDKIGTLLKYKGKTNELFTRMMINVAMLSSKFTPEQPVDLLDPVAGKGTTLFEAATYGFNAFGIEIETKSVQEATLFFKKYLETERIKHRYEKLRFSGTSKSAPLPIHLFEYALTKEAYRLDNARKKLGIACGNTMETDKYFKRRKFHLIVGDLPYGIAHGNANGKRTENRSRNPYELLRESLPAWAKVLHYGGCIVLAWNSFLINREKLTELFTRCGLEVLTGTPYDNFEHMVDRSIKRDIVVARKPQNRSNSSKTSLTK